MKTFSLQSIFWSATTLAPFICSLIMIVGTAYLYWGSRFSAERRRDLFVRLIAVIIGFRVAYAGLMTGLQYYVWSQDPMGKLLLPPTQGIAYFSQYVWTHFWFNAIISFGVGLLMFLILRTLEQKNPRFFETGEVELGTLLSLVVGWPHFIIFFPLVFICVVLFSIFRGIAFKEPFTTLGMPFIVASAIALFIALPLLSFLHLSTWII